MPPKLALALTFAGALALAQPAAAAEVSGPATLFKPAVAP